LRPIARFSIWTTPCLSSARVVHLAVIGHEAEGERQAPIGRSASFDCRQTFCRVHAVALRVVHGQLSVAPSPYLEPSSRWRRGVCAKLNTGRAASGWCDFSPGGALGPVSLVQGPLRAATAHGGRLMSPEAKFSWLTAAVAVALFGLIVLSLDRITPRDENGAMLAIPQRSS
jgi:hypothetical protein